MLSIRPLQYNKTARIQMKYIDLTLPTPSQNLALDEVLLDQSEAGLNVGVLRFWEPGEPFVVVGYANKIAREVNLPFCSAQGIPVLRRCSGGGTVLQGAGVLNYSLILPISETGALSTIGGTNTAVMEKNAAALSNLLQRNILVLGTSDLTLDGKKFSGNAQRRRRRFLLFHGTFLLKADLALIGQALQEPPRQPEYRENRTHGDFVTNLDVSAESVKAKLREAWGAHEVLEEVPLELLDKLVAEKYSQREWNEKF